MKLLLVVFTVVALNGCSDSGDWACMKGKNANGQSITYSQNLKTGELGAASKACD